MSDFWNKIIGRLWKSDVPNSNGTAIHLQNGDQHLVSIESMKVIIVKDGEGWFAQSLDIDYFAGGTTLDDVKHNFEEGLALTIASHLEYFGNIDKIMRTPKMEDWRPLIACDHGVYDVTTVSLHEIESMKNLDSLPFRNISFYQERAAA